MLLWRQLRSKQLEGFKFRRQEPIGNYIADFVISPSPNPSHQGRGSSYADAVGTKGDET
ncbi:MAG: DUF559 domain-containing protein [bacterium]